MIYKSLSVLQSIHANQKKENEASSNTASSVKEEDIIDAEFKVVDKDK
jgi:hypothetical protein